MKADLKLSIVVHVDRSLSEESCSLNQNLKKPKRFNQESLEQSVTSESRVKYRIAILLKTKNIAFYADSSLIQIPKQQGSISETFSQGNLELTVQ